MKNALVDRSFVSDADGLTEHYVTQTCFISHSEKVLEAQIVRWKAGSSGVLFDLTSLSAPYSKVRFRGTEVIALGRLKLGSDSWSGTM